MGMKWKSVSPLANYSALMRRVSVRCSRCFGRKVADITNTNALAIFLSHIVVFPRQMKAQLWGRAPPGTVAVRHKSRRIQAVILTTWFERPIHFITAFRERSCHFGVRWPYSHNLIIDITYTSHTTCQCCAHIM
jgi:hypothetical protein